jgi:ATP-dependent Lon protease
MSDPTGPSGGTPHPDNHESTFVAPLFPLPNVVLFPGAVLPLHVFEERYKAMTRDALAGGRRQIAMALLTQGWEKDYYCRPAIEPVVCVGRILSHERLPDGRYNFLLQGTTRARVVRELSADEDDDVPADCEYRLAVLRPLVGRPADADAMAAGRGALRSVFVESAYARTPLGKRFVDLLRGDLPTADLIDLIAFNFIDDVAVKQAMLAEADVLRRVGLLVRALAPAAPMVSASVRMYGRPGLN